MSSMPEKDLTKNKEYVAQYKDKLLQAYRNKYVLIYDGDIISSFDTYEVAATEAIRVYGPEGNFLVHFITEQEPLNFVMDAQF